MEKYFEDDAAFYEALEAIDEMLAEEPESNVMDFLSSVKSDVDDTGFITGGQYDGVMNCYRVFDERNG